MIKPVRLLRITLGVLLILVGAVGHLIPLFPGTYFIVAGILLLAEAVPAVQVRLKRIEDRYPYIHTIIGHLRSSDGSLNLTRVTLSLIAVIIVFGTTLFLLVRLLRGY